MSDLDKAEPSSTPDLGSLSPPAASTPAPVPVPARHSSSGGNGISARAQARAPGRAQTERIAPGFAHDSGGGQALPEPARAAMAERFGYSFDDVRVHTDAHAATAAAAMGAAAFTLGADIAFAPGQYRPITEAGQLLLAHELAHVVQQRAGNSNDRFESDDLGGEHDPEERDADAAARFVAWGIRLSDQALSASRRRVRRAPETWFRGEAVGVKAAMPGEWIHDLGEGLYFTDLEIAAEKYAKMRVRDNPGTRKSVGSVTIERSELGRVLDLTKDTRWQQFIKQRAGKLVFEDTLKIPKN